MRFKRSPWVLMIVSFFVVAFLLVRCLAAFAAMGAHMFSDAPR
jgi:hypothetical protein